MSGSPRDIQLSPRVVRPTPVNVIPSPLSSPSSRKEQSTRLQQPIPSSSNSVLGEFELSPRSTQARMLAVVEEPDDERSRHKQSDSDDDTSVSYSRSRQARSRSPDNVSPFGHQQSHAAADDDSSEESDTGSSGSRQHHHHSSRSRSASGSNHSSGSSSSSEYGDDDLLWLDEQSEPETKQSPRRRHLHHHHHHRHHHHHHHHRCVMRPSNPFKMFWDVVVLLLLVYVVFVMPFRLAFVEDDAINPTDVTVDVLFLIDIILTFFTAYEDRNGRLVTSHSIIAKRYLATWFVIDALATFPFYLVGSASLSRISALARLPRLLKLFRLVRLLKLLRAYRFQQCLAEYENRPEGNIQVLTVCKIFMVLVAFAHVTGCLWYFIGELQEEGDDAWLRRAWGPDDPIQDTSVAYRYVVSVYFTLTCSATLGFGDITARSIPEFLFYIFLMLSGSIIFAYTTAVIASIMGSTDHFEAARREKIDNLRDFTKGVGLSKSLAKRVHKHMVHVWKQPIKHHADWSEIMQEMPAELRDQVALEMYSDLVSKSPFFGLFDDDEDDGDSFVIDVVGNLRPVEFPQGEYIAHFNDPCLDWYIIQKGEVHAVSSIDPSLVYMRLSDGDSFGEMGILITNRWEVSVRAATDVTCLTCPSKVFARLLSKKNHRRCVEKVLQHAQHRLGKLKRARLRNKALTLSHRALDILGERKANPISPLSRPVRSMQPPLQRRTTFTTLGMDQNGGGAVSSSSVLSPPSDTRAVPGAEEVLIVQMLAQIDRLTESVRGMRRGGVTPTPSRGGNHLSPTPMGSHDSNFDFL